MLPKCLCQFPNFPISKYWLNYCFIFFAICEATLNFGYWTLAIGQITNFIRPMLRIPFIPAKRWTWTEHTKFEHPELTQVQKLKRGIPQRRESKQKVSIFFILWLFDNLFVYPEDLNKTQVCYLCIRRWKESCSGQMFQPQTSANKLEWINQIQRKH